MQRSVTSYSIFTTTQFEVMFTRCTPIAFLIFVPASQYYSFTPFGL
jgi:hypothetical protein